MLRLCEIGWEGSGIGLLMLDRKTTLNRVMPEREPQPHPREETEARIFNLRGPDFTFAGYSLNTNLVHFDLITRSPPNQALKPRRPRSCERGPMWMCR